MRFTSRALVASALMLGSMAATLSPAMAAGERHQDDRLPATVTRHTSDYDFELILTPHVGEPGSPTAWARRTDDVGSSGDEPDSHGFVQSSSWDAQSGRNCVTSSGGEFGFDDAPVHALTYGITGRAVRTVVVVLEDGTRIPTPTSKDTVDGFRGWMIERPLVTTARIDGYDGHGRRVTSYAVDHSFSDADDFGSADTCVPFPF